MPKDKFRISKNKFRIPRDCFASLAMTKILEFPNPCVIPQPDQGISSQNRDPPKKKGWG